VVVVHPAGPVEKRIVEAVRERGVGVGNLVTEPFIARLHRFYRPLLFEWLHEVRLLFASLLLLNLIEKENLRVVTRFPQTARLDEAAKNSCICQFV
jgi:hypothetical protein